MPGPLYTFFQVGKEEVKGFPELGDPRLPSAQNGPHGKAAHFEVALFCFPVELPDVQLTNCLNSH